MRYEEQIALFDPVKGERLKEAAIAQALRHAREEWREKAMGAIEMCALRYASFTTDQVELMLGYQTCKTHDTRALGGLMQTARRRGWIDPTDRVEASAMSRNHRRPKRIWRSTIRGAGMGGR